MEKIEKIIFPHFIDHTITTDNRIVVFFGADFYNLPLDSNRDAFIEKTNQMLSYIRKHFEGCGLIYQAHPNEKDESSHLDLSGFTIGERTIAEIFLYQNAPSIAYVFSACSGASISAFSMGFQSAVFIDTLHGALSEETFNGYKSYFGGLPDYFFIQSFTDPLPQREPHASIKEKEILKGISHTVNNAKKAWVIASDPSLGLRGAIVLKELKKNNPDLKTGLVMISHNRWNLIDRNKSPFFEIDELITIPQKKIWYSLRPPRMWRALKTAWFLKKLPIGKDDALISVAHAQFEENCILSFFPNIKKILLIENRWYQFVYEDGFKSLDQNRFITLPGVRFFNFFLEPLLRLHKTQYNQYDDGKVLNIFRYKKSLEDIYDKTYVLMPATFAFIKKTDEN